MVVEIELSAFGLMTEKEVSGVVVVEIELIVDVAMNDSVPSVEEREVDGLPLAVETLSLELISVVLEGLAVGELALEGDVEEDAPKVDVAVTSTITVELIVTIDDVVEVGLDCPVLIPLELVSIVFVELELDCVVLEKLTAGELELSLSVEVIVVNVEVTTDDTGEEVAEEVLKVERALTVETVVTMEEVDVALEKDEVVDVVQLAPIVELSKA